DSDAPSPVRMSAPALLIQTSRRPRSRRAAAASSPSGAASVRSSGTTAVRRPSVRMACRTSSAPAALARYVSATAAPARANARAIARPMPLDPPVTRTARPTNGVADVIIWPDDTVNAMQLLVSVSGAAEASAALDGGADIVDAKDPHTGPLGAVSLDVLREIGAAVAGRRPVTAASGDATHESGVGVAARAVGRAGSRFVKLGFAGIADAPRIARLAAAARCGLEAVADRVCGLVIVAYADFDRAGTLPPSCFVDIGARAGASGVLLDTADKNG